MLFIKGLELYGKGWKKIASLIKTRTVVQIRTHAQKYFLKLSKARQNGEYGGNLTMDGKSLSHGNRKVS
jgi:SHAQKYF class myb-like DNA-binding protein